MSPVPPCSVTLIGNYVPDEQESMLRFAAALEKELRSEGVEVKTIRPSPILYRFKTGRGSLDKWIGYLDKFVLFPFFLRKEARAKGASRVIFHICDHSNAMYGSCLRGNWLITCHDLLAVQSALGEIPENPTRLTGRVLQSWILSGLRQAKHVGCDSKHTADQVIRLAGLPAERVRVIRLDLNQPFAPMNEVKRGGILDQLFESRGLPRPARYLFHVGGNQWYKNRRRLIEIFSRIVPAQPDLQLVFAGKNLPVELTVLIGEKGLSRQVRSIGEVSHGELNALYAGAEALVFPSLAEGFGWPLVEAQASGCPVFASDRAPLNEITNDSAILIDPLAVEETAQIVLKFLAWRPEEKATLIEKGLANAAHFQTRRMVREYLEFYRDIFSSRE